MKAINMKFKKIAVALGVACVTMSSCDLTEKPSSFVAPSNFYQNKEQCIASLNSCYIPLKSIYRYEYLIVTEACTDLSWVASGTLDAQLAISPSNARFGQNMWTQGYKGVMYSNAVIAGIQGSKAMKEEDKKPLIAEGMVMRAFYYNFLTSMFGDIPFYTEDVADEIVLERVTKLGRMPAKATRDYLIKELRENIKYMPQVRTVDLPQQRCGAAVGWVLVAKMAMWNKEWEIARDACLELEKIYGDLNNYPLEDLLFRKKNTPESILELQSTYSTSGLKVATSIACITTPPRSKANDGYTYDGVVIKELGNTATTWTALRPSKYYFNSLMIRDGDDKRTQYNMAWEYNGVEFADVTKNKRPWMGPKFWCPDMVNTSDANNPKIFRYADAVLMLAECYLNLEKYDLAIKKLNSVKERAGIETYPEFTNRDALMEEIQKERARELFGEFHRKPDLVRWGIWFQQTYDYTDYSSLKNQMRPCHEYYPIPDNEVVYSGYTLNNKAYEKYGL